MGLIGKGRHDSNNKGQISEATITARLLQAGYIVLIPYGGTVLKFDTANHNVTGTKRDWRHYRGQCEYFAVYSADLNKVYLIPVDNVGTTRAHLRLEPSNNRQ